MCLNDPGQRWQEQRVPRRGGRSEGSERVSQKKIPLNGIFLRVKAEAGRKSGTLRTLGNDGETSWLGSDPGPSHSR